MRWRQTWLLTGLAAVLLAFILLYERHVGGPQSPTAPPRLLPQLRPAEVTAVQISRSNQLVLAVERTGEAWNLTLPLNYPAAPVAVQRLLGALEQTLAPVRFSPRELSSRGQQLSEFGLDKPSAVVALRQGPTRLELQFGAPTPLGDQVYAQIVGLPGVCVVEASLLQLLPKNANTWRNLALFDLAGWNFDRVEVVRTNAGICLQREPTNQVWFLTRPRQRADQLKVEGLLERIQQARVTQFVADDPKVDLDRYGLQPPQVELALGRGTNLSQRVLFGRSPPDSPSNVYALRLSQTNVVLMPRSLLDAINLPAAEFRDRRLLDFQPSDVTLIEVRSEEPFTIRRQTNDTWLAGENILADGPFMRDWLLRLSHLEVAEFVKDVVTDFSSYGLAQPSRQYILKTSLTNAAGLTNAILSEVQFGSNTARRVYARRPDEDSVYAIHYVDYYRMPAAAWQLRDRRVWSFTTNQVSRLSFRQGDRSRSILRGPNGDWTVAPGSHGVINPLAVEEMAFRLGELNAVMWAARGKENLPAYGFGATNLQLSVDLQIGEKTQTLTLDFGGLSPGRLRYAATLLDNQIWIFEFPMFLFEDLDRALGWPLR